MISEGCHSKVADWEVDTPHTLNVVFTGHISWQKYVETLEEYTMTIQCSVAVNEVKLKTELDNQSK